MWTVPSLLHLFSVAIVGLASQVQPAVNQVDQSAGVPAATAQHSAQPVPPADGGESASVPVPADSPDSAEATETEPEAPWTDSESFLERLRTQLPDPAQAKAEAKERFSSATGIEKAPLEELIRRIDMVARPDQVQLTLADALQRTVRNNFAIRVSSYNPAIETTRVVEAEAAFDVILFADVTNDKRDQPAANTLFGTQIQEFNARSGIRKLLASGMQVEASYQTQRTSNNFQFQTINPVWFDQFIVQFRQPLLRGFGVDFNRSQIRLSKLDRRRATQQFRGQIRDTLFETEDAFYRVVQARRNLVISAKLLADFEQIYNFLDARKEFDVYRIQLADTKARLERSKAQFIELITDVHNAEDRLIALMNDPKISLADDVEIIPVDLPPFQRVVIDRVAEVQTALEFRSELVEAKLAIDIARIQIGVAKNQALPQFDVTFGYTVDGLGVSQHDSFSEVTKHDFTEYFVGINFEIPVGNRGRRASVRRAKLQYAQAIANLKRLFEQVILDVNVSVRTVQARYDQIDPILQSTEATEDRVDSIIARAEKKDFLTLNNELNARQALAESRSTLMAALVDYAIAIADLERAKGTLLRYNNFDLVFDDSDDPAD